MKIVITDAQTLTNGDLDLTVFEKYGEVEVYSLTSPEEAKVRLKDADAVLLNKTPMNEEVLKDAKNLKYIGLFATGYNVVDIPYCRTRGITVSNAGSYSTDAVAQHTFAFILNHYSKVSDYGKFVAEGGWMNSPVFSPFVFPTMELAGKKLGLVGYGAIAKKVAEIGKAFGMKVVATPHDLEKAKAQENPLGVTFMPLSEMLAVADIVSCHCPLNSESAEMFNAKTFSEMKDGAFFVNTSRGGILVEKDLRGALVSGKLSGAGLDVLTVEPMDPSCALFGAPNLILTPHVAWAPLETRERLMGIVEDNLKNFIEGHPTHVVS